MTIKVEGNEMTNKEQLTRLLWMSDVQWALYQEVVKLNGAIVDAIRARDRDTWQKLTLRVREVNRLVQDQMFS
jgi:hypothetical protein